MSLNYENGNSGKWHELAIGFKWPHQGFTLGYDFIMPYEQDESIDYNCTTIMIFLGCFSIVFNYGN
tara:strand:- start:3055 stop:3252 length:198 start_codon:yes stop_codon:yes gene_type:complete